MADLKISQLGSIVTVVPATDVLPVVQGATTYKMTPNQILGSGGVATLASATITGAATVGTTLGVTGVSTFAAGTALLPALTTTGDTNTGIYYPAADTFAVTTGGTERYRVDSTGLGIGVAPQAKLHAYTLNPTDGVVELLQNLSTSGQTGAKTKYEVANVGASGIGTPNGTTNALAFFVGGITSAEERARIDASGRLLVGTTALNSNAPNSVATFKSTIADWTSAVWNSNAAPFGLLVQYDSDPNSVGREFLACYGAANVRAKINSNGGISNYQANDVNLSDIRTKTDIKPLTSYWNKIKALELVTFKYKDQTHDDDNIGLIAQQVESVAPEFVDVDGFGNTPEDGVPLKTIYTTDLYHAAIKALQEAMTRIEVLESKLA